MKSFKYFLLSLAIIPSFLFAQGKKDPFLWLEEIDSPKSMEWVKAQDTITVNALEKFPEFQNLYENNLKILNSKERIAYPSIVGSYIYNFWQEAYGEEQI